MDERSRKIMRDAEEKIALAESLGMEDWLSPGEITARLGKLAGVYPVPNLAVEICCDTRMRLVQQLGKNATGEALERISRLGYCMHLPRLNDAASIRDFIACVVYGMAIGAIPSSEGTRLLYGAQVALAALPGDPKKRKKHTKTPTNASSTEPPTPEPSAD
jgi:hypothetical protein